MQAVVMTGIGGLDMLKSVKVPVPSRPEGSVLVKVHSTSVNAIDNAIRAGAFPVASLPKVLGIDVAGLVEEHDSTSKFKKGDRVAGVSMGGPQDTWAEYAVVQEGVLASVPSSIPLSIAGAIPAVGITAYQALQAGDPEPGKRVLVHAAAGGVGTFAVQIAKAWGMHVVGTCGPDNLSFVKEELGADEAVNYRTDDIVALYKDKPFDIVVDAMGKRGNAFVNSLAVLKPGGHLSHVASGYTDQQAIGAAMEAHAQGQGPAVSVTIMKASPGDLGQVLALIEQGKVKVMLDRSLPLFEGAVDGAAHVETGHARGKVVLVAATE